MGPFGGFRTEELNSGAQDSGGVCPGAPRLVWSQFLSQGGVWVSLGFPSKAQFGIPLVPSNGGNQGPVPFEPTGTQRGLPEIGPGPLSFRGKALGPKTPGGALGTPGCRKLAGARYNRHLGGPPGVWAHPRGNIKLFFCPLWNTPRGFPLRPRGKIIPGGQFGHFGPAGHRLGNRHSGRRTTAQHFAGGAPRRNI